MDKSVHTKPQQNTTRRKRIAQFLISTVDFLINIILCLEDINYTVIAGFAMDASHV